MASFRFCQECNNMLYPNQDTERRSLLYKCRNCNYAEDASNPCVYRNDLISATRETAGVTVDLGTDPSLPRSNIVCPKCRNEEAVFFQSQGNRQDTRMVLFYVCTNPKCGHQFKDPRLKER